MPDTVKEASAHREDQSNSSDFTSNSSDSDEDDTYSQSAKSDGRAMKLNVESVETADKNNSLRRRHNSMIVRGGKESQKWL